MTPLRISFLATFLLSLSHNLIYFSLQGAKITKASHFNQPFQLGGKINILCIADGSPKPTITWYKDGAELVYKYNIHLQEQTEPDGKQRSRIEIDPATVGDQGVYSCVVHNKYGSMVKNFKSEYFY
ncbi:unnamed protein product [Soboliphyme baturini]|uniref:Ig-like domain-containing protein n=1 Tax=Soboliphyme baturini TaxID=241478 RepID=A0A183I9F7_9BILA|nr:unnamed protein product [Soboliphyme baturini]